MSKKSKVIIFFILVALFLTTLFFSLLYAQGYRIDIKNGKMTQTGGIFVKIIPVRAEVKVGDLSPKATNLFWGSLLIENLLPSVYKVSAQKQGLQKWVKKLNVKEKTVTEAKNIILFPKKLAFNKLSDGEINAYLSGDKNTAIFVESKKLFSPVSPDEIVKQTGKSLKLYDIQRKIKSQLISLNKFNFGADNPQILNITLSADNQKALIEIAAAEKVKYFILNLASGSPKLIPLNFLPKNTLNVYFASPSGSKLFISTPQKRGGVKAKSLSEINVVGIKINSSPIISGFIAFALNNQNIYWLSQKGWLFQKKLSGGKTEKLNQAPFQVEKGEILYRLLAQKNNIALIEGKSLFLLDKKSGVFEKELENVSKTAFWAGGEKIAISGEHEIWLYAGKEKIFLTRISQKIKNIFWLNPNYILFNTDKGIDIIETDNRDKPQIWQISDIAAEKMFFNQKNKEIYLLNKDRFLASDPIY